jgi:hypothetical protein
VSHGKVASASPSIGTNAVPRQSCTSDDAAKVADSSGAPHPANGVCKGERRGGRQSGTPNRATAEIKGLARMHGADAIEQLARIMSHGTSEAVQIAAARELLDRGYGRPTQAITGDPDGAPIALVIYTGVDRDPDGDDGGDE